MRAVDSAIAPPIIRAFDRAFVSSRAVGVLLLGLAAVPADTPGRADREYSPVQHRWDPWKTRFGLSSNNFCCVCHIEKS